MTRPSTTAHHAPDPSRCPLCGQPNQCAMQAARDSGTASGPCWCAGVKFDPALLARVPAPARRKACICPICASPGDVSHVPHP